MLLPLLPLLDWSEDFYFGPGSRQGNGRHAHLFPPEIGNLHQRVLFGQDRRLDAELGMRHPTLRRFTGALGKVQGARDMRYGPNLIIFSESPLKKK